MESTFRKKNLDGKIISIFQKTNANIWRSFNGILAKTANHLPAERMHLTIVIEEKTKLFFELRQEVSEFSQNF